MHKCSINHQSQSEIIPVNEGFSKKRLSLKSTVQMSFIPVAIFSFRQQERKMICNLPAIVKIFEKFQRFNSCEAVVIVKCDVS